MKYRIIKYRALYYPQYEYCFIWWRYYKDVFDNNKYYATIEDAEKFINEQIQDSKEVITVVKEIMS